MAVPGVRDERGRFKASRHPCTAGKAKAGARKPGTVNGTATKKAAVRSAKGVAAAKKTAVRRRKTAVKGRAAAVKTAAKQSGKTAGKHRPC